MVSWSCTCLYSQSNEIVPEVDLYETGLEVDQYRWISEKTIHVFDGLRYTSIHVTLCYKYAQKVITTPKSSP